MFGVRVFHLNWFKIKQMTVGVVVMYWSGTDERSTSARIAVSDLSPHQYRWQIQTPDTGLPLLLTEKICEREAEKLLANKEFTIYLALTSERKRAMLTWNHRKHFYTKHLTVWEHKERKERSHWAELFKLVWVWNDRRLTRSTKARLVV